MDAPALALSSLGDCKYLVVDICFCQIFSLVIGGDSALRILLLIVWFELCIRSASSLRVLFEVNDRHHSR